jgi:hypothetical protein
MPEYLNRSPVAASIVPGLLAYCEIDAYLMKNFPLLLNRKIMQALSMGKVYLVGCLPSNSVLNKFSFSFFHFVHPMQLPV